MFRWKARGAWLVAAMLAGIAQAQEPTALSSDRVGEAVNFGLPTVAAGSTIAMGASADDENAAASGAVHVFVRDVTTAAGWVRQAKVLPADGGSHDRFGYRLALDGDALIVASRIRAR